MPFPLARMIQKQAWVVWMAGGVFFQGVVLCPVIFVIENLLVCVNGGCVLSLGLFLLNLLIC